MRLSDLPPDLRLLGGAPFTRLTDAEFFDLCQANEQWQFERNAHHEILVMPPVGSDSSESCGEIFFQLALWNRRQSPPPGHVYESSGGFLLPDGSVRSPDAAWLSQAAWAALTPAQRQRFPPVCPEFVIELRSPSDSVRYLQAKMEAYLTNGVQLGFLLDPAAETAYVYAAGQPPQTLVGFDRELSGEPLLPGFRLDLRPLRGR